MLDLLPTTQTPTDSIRILLVIFIFTFFTIKDIKTRRIENKYWPPLIIIGIILIIIDLYLIHTQSIHILTTETTYLIQILLTITITTILAFTIYYVAGFGGADAKALITLSFIFPTTPTILTNTTSLPLYPPVHDIFTLTILTNAVLIVPVYILYRIIDNILTINTRKEIDKWIIVGKRIPTSQITNNHGLIIEDKNGYAENKTDIDTIKQYLSYYNTTLNNATPTVEQVEEFLNEHEQRYHPDNPEQIINTIQLLQQKEHIWITPGLPFILPLTIGIVLSLLFGSLPTALTI